ncbi:hypothetical protein F443_17572 [Phytophthora nicotianae P1569]|uniref:Uncharacterized protein n=1 Tax=Phytophthora nicotianae P1569 TaxID=1317065 RepID=V9EDE3_PHYNI|nr:hypothetical protein F443_17572 [Phytophthora nicotianae P1569]
MDNYGALTTVSDNQYWQGLLECDGGESIQIDVSEHHDAEIFEEYDPVELLPTTLEDVEAI